MHPGDLVWVKPLKKYATIIDVCQPTVRYPAMIVDVIFFDDTEASTFYARSLQVIASGNRKDDDVNMQTFYTRGII